MVVYMMFSFPCSSMMSYLIYIIKGFFIPPNSTLPGLDLIPRSVLFEESDSAGNTGDIRMVLQVR